MAYHKLNTGCIDTCYDLKTVQSIFVETFFHCMLLSSARYWLQTCHHYMKLFFLSLLNAKRCLNYHFMAQN